MDLKKVIDTLYLIDFVKITDGHHELHFCGDVKL